MNLVLLALGTSVTISTIFAPSCAARGIEVVFYIHDGYTFSRAEQRTIQSIAEQAVDDARRVLPQLPTRLTIRVSPGKGKMVIDEIGSSSSYSLPNVVHWMVDPAHSSGVSTIATEHLRPAVFQQAYRITREAHTRPITLMDWVVGAGMAAAFERDFGGRHYPWAEYPAEVDAWAKELMSLPSTSERNPWIYGAPKARRWMGIRVGTYLTDLAIRGTGKSAAQLVFVPTEQILRFARSE